MSKTLENVAHERDMHRTVERLAKADRVEDHARVTDSVRVVTEKLLRTLRAIRDDANSE
jgi:hypothetical protein